MRRQFEANFSRPGYFLIDPSGNFRQFSGRRLNMIRYAILPLLCISDKIGKFQPTFNRTEIAKVPTFQFSADYSDQGIRPLGTTTLLNKRILDIPTIRAILVPQDNEKRVRSLPVTYATDKILVKMLLSFENHIPDNRHGRQDAREQSLQHLPH